MGAEHVIVFDYQKHKDAMMDRGYIEDLHRILRNRVGSRFYIIAPAASVKFLEDYVEMDGTKYFVLRIPYSIIEEIHKRGFTHLKQPISETDVNDTVDAVGFDFIQIPKVECDYFRESRKGQLELGTDSHHVSIRIKKFESKIMSRKVTRFENFETLSMVMLDYSFNGNVFELDDTVYADQLRDHEYTIGFDRNKIESKMMIIYLDIFGNEKREVKTLSDFSR